MNLPIQNRKQLIIESALAINNFLDCDVVQYNITKIEESTMLEDIINYSTDLIHAIEFRGKEPKAIVSLVAELMKLKQ